MNIILQKIKFDRIRRQFVLYHLLVCLALYLVAGCSSAFLTSDARRDGMIDRHSNAILTNPDWPKPYYYRSILYKEIGEYEKALADAKKYCELAPEDIVCSQLIKEYGFEPPLISYAKEKEDLKRKLHESIEKQDLSVQKKNELVAALYEKERQLNTKNAQLDIAKQKFDEYQRQIETLNRRAQDLNRQLMQVQSKEEVSGTQAELERIFNRKAQLEPEVDHLTVQKQKLHEEVSNLNRLIANARHEFEKAKKELLEVRQRETRLEEQLA